MHFKISSLIIQELSISSLDSVVILITGSCSILSALLTDLKYSKNSSVMRSASLFDFSILFIIFQNSLGFFLLQLS